MEFDVKRLAKLSGLPPETSGLLTESAEEDVVQEATEDEAAAEFGAPDEFAPEDVDQLTEAAVRKIIREEIAAVMEEMSSGVRKSAGPSSDDKSGSSWIYGDKQPTNSKKGRVHIGLLGVGFK